MSTNKQRRESERQRLQRQLEERRQREVARRRFTTLASIVGALVLVAAIVVIVVVASNSGDDKKTASKPSTTPTTAPSTAASTAPATPADPVLTTPCAAAGGSTTSYKGVTVTGATNVKAEPKLTSKGTAAPATLFCQDLVVGKGAVIAKTATVKAQYVGALYATGKVFQSSWATGAVPFPLAQVVPGFRLGIAGSGKVAPMHVGGRRLLILPSALAYGANPPSGSGIPANAPLVFIVDATALGS